MKASDRIVFFADEDVATTKIAEFITNSAVSLHLTTKYIYALSYDSFYKCDIKDLLKVVLNNIFQPSLISALNIEITGGHCAPMDCDEYDRTLPLIMYNFATRLPTLQKMNFGSDTLSDTQIQSIYDKLIANGAQNYRSVVDEDFESIRKLVKKNKPIPSFLPTWYKIFLYESIPVFAEINNRNMFFFGAMDILFTMFYLHMQEELREFIKNLDKRPTL